MKRIQYHRYGGPNEMRLEDFEPRQPGRGEVLVRIKAASVNPIDWKVRQGDMKFMTGGKFPRAMGTDFAGVVEAVGPSVERIKVGQEVLGTTSLGASGAFAEMAVTPEKLVVAKPPSLSFEAAAALTLTSATAWRGLVDLAHLQAGQSVFVHGCLGGVGRAAVQIARALGAGMVAGSCRASAMEEARQTGLDRVADFSQLDLHALAGAFDIVFDTTGLLSLSDARSLLKRGGVILDTAPPPGKMLRGMFTPQFKMVIAKPVHETLSEIVKLADQGKIQPTIGKIAPLAEAIQAISDLERSGTPKGKLVVTM